MLLITLYCNCDTGCNSDQFHAVRPAVQELNRQGLRTGINCWDSRQEDTEGYLCACDLDLERVSGRKQKKL